MPSLDNQGKFISSSSSRACGLVSRHPAGCFILVFFTAAAAAAARNFAKKRESRLLAAVCGTERLVRDHSRLPAGFSCDQEELLGFSSSQRCSEEHQEALKSQPGEAEPRWEPEPRQEASL